MKNFLLSMLLIFGLVQTNAQITLSRSDMPLQVGSSIDLVALDEASVPTPTEGPNQVWDYTSVVPIGSDNFTLNANNDAVNFPDSDGYNTRLSFQFVAEFDRSRYYVLNDSVFGRNGVKYDALDVPITTTGNPADVISFADNYGHATSNLDYVAWFPMNYGDTRSGTFEGTNNAEISIAAFGLDKAPFLHQWNQPTSTYEVAGWGTLNMTNPANQSLVELEVLMVKRVAIQQDSFFLYGLPAPETFLSAFGLVQGQQNTSTSYEFFAKGYNYPVLSISGSGASMMADLNMGQSITIERSDMPLQVGSLIDLVELDQASVAMPTEGPNQVWDYTSAIEIGPDNFTLNPNNDAINFPDADGFHKYSSFRFVAEFDRSDYYVLNDSVFARSGVKFDALDVPVTTAGNPDDVISFADNYGHATSNLDYSAWFPMNFGDTRNSSFEGTNNAEISIAAFGLDKAPFLHKWDQPTSAYEVAGWGTLKATNPADQSIVELEVLMMKRVVTQQDSFFLYGAPAPETFLNAFGLVQGQQNTSTSYEFFAKGYNYPVLSIDGDAAYMLADLNIGQPITLERADMPLQVGSSIDLVELEQASVANPTEGSNQVWDYTAVVPVGPDMFTLNPNNDAVNFPDADGYNKRLSFQLIAEFDRSDYYVLNDSVFGRNGVKYDALDVPITTTGNPADVISFADNYGHATSNLDYVAWFPMNYGDTRSGTFEGANNSEISIAAFGLDKAPFLHQWNQPASEYEVAGWGTLNMTNPVDQSLVELEVLLVKRVVIQQDSFFLYGLPAPETFLSAFGLVQGQQSTNTSYEFFAKGYNYPVLSISGGGAYMLADLNITTSTEEFVNDKPFNLKYYPNPATDHLNLEFEKTTQEPYTFVVYNTLGQKVLERVVAQPVGSVKEFIVFPQPLQAGNYFFALHNGGQEVMTSGVLQIK